jgi:hypothetical protein
MPKNVLHVRIPEALAQLVRRLADEQGVTVNAMLVALLSRATADYPLTAPPEVEDA